MSMSKSSIVDRLDVITSIASDRLQPVPPSPTSAKIELTSRCNFDCTYCARRSAKRPHGDMERGDYQAIIKDLYDSGVTQLGLFYLGESTLVDWLPEAVEDAVSTGFSNVFLTTNGSLLTADLTRRLMSAGLNSIKFSLNYDSASQQCDIAGTKEAVYEAVNTNVIAAWAVRSAEGFKCELSACYIAYNEEQSARMQDRVRLLDAYIDTWYAMPLYSQGGRVDGRVTGNTGMLTIQKPSLPCWVMFNQAHIDHFGNLTMCCFDHSGDFVVGNLRETPFAELWGSEKFSSLRKRHIEMDVAGTLCEGCIHGTAFKQLS